jgi:hypothetical protein
VIRGALIGVVVWLVSWVVLAFLVWEIVAVAVGREDAMRLVPYVNAHLLEEAVEGAYTPWRDPVFLLRLVANTVLPFGLAASVAVRSDRRAALAVFAVGAAALISVNRHVFAAGFPDAVRAGFLMELAAATIACASAWAWGANYAGGPPNKELQRTRPAQATEPRR